MLDPRIAGAAYLVGFMVTLFVIAVVVAALLKRHVRRKDEFEHAEQVQRDALRGPDDWDTGPDVWDGDTSRPDFMDGGAVPERRSLDPHTFPHLPGTGQGTPTRPRQNTGEVTDPLAGQEADSGKERLLPPRRPKRKRDDS